MASSQTKIFKISLSKDLFVDPSFSKKYSTYLPLKKSFLNSRLVDKMSPTCLKLVLILLDHAHNVRSTCFDLASDMFPSCREPVENVLLRLERYQVLTEPPLLINELNNKESNKAEDVPLEPAKDFSNISNSTMLSNIPLSKSAEFQEIENALTSTNVFGTDFPPALRRGKNNFISRILVAYEFNTDDFKRDLTSIINESLLDEITDAGKSDYIAARVKKKALEVFNATR